MNLQNNTSFSELSNILDNQLINSFKPHVDAIPNVESKGIYFWFMKQKAYSKLSQFETISPIESTYSKFINGEKYDLIYLGTAGTGKKGNSNLKNRFDWHIQQEHNNSQICSGTLSTLRAGLGALIAEDLILPNTEELVNTFMKNSMILFWVEYPNNNELIDSDEKILINTIKPLLNLKSNSNARLTSIDNSTKSYKRRRALVYKNTRLRLSCKGESEKSMKTFKTPTVKSPNYDDQILDVNNNCVEYYVSNGQFIDEVTRGIDNLPTHKAKIQIWDSNNTENVFNEWQFRSTGDELKPDAQNIYTYFSNTHNNIKRADVIMNWMNTNQIEEITVRVCSIGNEIEKSINSKQLKQNKLVNVSIDENSIPANASSILNKNIYLIPCSSKKIQLEKMENKKFNIEKLEFNNELGKYRKIILEKLKNTNSHKRKKNGITNSIINSLNLIKTAQANVLYSEGKLYNTKSSESINWNKNKKEKIYIISALFGIIRADNYIPNYDLAMTDEIDNVKNYAQKFWKGKMDEIIKNLVEDGNIVYNLLSKNYCNIFNSKIISLTIIPKIDYKKSDANGKRGKWLKNNL